MLISIVLFVIVLLVGLSSLTSTVVDISVEDLFVVVSLICVSFSLSSDRSLLAVVVSAAPLSFTPSVVIEDSFVVFGLLLFVVSFSFSLVATLDRFVAFAFPFVDLLFRLIKTMQKLVLQQ